jgi:hypothetical protein
MMLLWGFGVLFTAGDALAQGTVHFSTYVPASGINAPVLLWPGMPATGPQYAAILLAGPSSPSALVGTPWALRTGALAGHITGGSVTIPNIPPGGPTFVQIVAFDSTLYADAAAVVAAGDGAVGTARSAVLFLTRTGDPTALPPELPVDLVGLTSICFCLPEPSVLWLALVGAGGWAGWRKSGVRRL